MLALTAILFGTLTTPAMAPVPPELRPDPMARGYMGITIGTGQLTVERVEPKMPAEKAGLRSGDIILRIGTLEPRTFEDVVSNVCAYRPGAVVEIEVQRGTERKTFKVKLAARPIELDQPRYSPPFPIDD